MIYKFDILFKKVLADAIIKVVTYCNLLDTPKAFGENENLKEAAGELSVVKEGTEKGFSINSLLGKYHSLLIGWLNAETWGKEFPLQFSFKNPDDVASIQAQLLDENDYLYYSNFETRKIDGEEELDLKNIDSFVVVISRDNNITLRDESGTETKISKGEVAFVMASAKKVTVDADNATIILITTA